MRITCETVLNGGLVLLVSFLGVHLNAQITDQVNADISHPFIVSTKTLPAGKYVFRMQEGNNTIMTVTSADGKDSDTFIVRESIAKATPAHTELVFNRYGDKEFLKNVYEGGNKMGVRVVETSKVEKQLVAQGQQPVTHTE
ncbi:MAG: hypothetical protein JOY54_18235 [Acidobacteriaceae bacterium]|nr:hypothetical protein [Acidobacteriaceae bacterium]